MNYRIVFEDGTTFPQPTQPTPVVTPLRSGREWRRLAVVGEIDAVKAAFVNGAKFSQQWDSEVSTVDEETGEVSVSTEVQSRDLSEWSIAGEIVDHRDGTVTVLMGKPTEVEILQAQLAAATAAE